MSIDLKVYDNGDHTALVWLPSDQKPIPHCLGFTVHRTRTRAGVTDERYLHSFVGFTQDAKLPADRMKQWQWPLQRYMWWDYGLKVGDVVQYRVIPVTGKDPAHAALNDALGSEATPKLTITSQCTPSMSAYFNKGVLASQWVSRELDKLAAAGKGRQTTASAHLSTPGDELRNELGGLLRSDLITLLTEAKAKNKKVFLLLYELEDEELQGHLKDLGAQVSLILANGAFSSDKPDESADVRKWLKTKTKVHVFDRMVTSGHFAHNKFAVVCDQRGKAEKVLTGSTNWTWRGLCSQVNNALVIDDPGVAGAYLDEWNRIKAAGDAYPKELAAANSKLQQFTVDDVKVTTWFAPTLKAPDLEYARNLINKAKESILFLFFNPGIVQEDMQRETLLQTIIERHTEGKPNYDPSLYIRGVVNQQIAGLTTGAVDVFTGAGKPPQKLNKDVLVPAAIKTRFSKWEDELLKIGVMVHSKVVVLDPFGEHPVLMTGSHNLGLKASSKNDDNLIIIEGASSLATAYAVNIIAIYQAYRWNHYVASHANDPHAWTGLQSDDQWQAGHLTGDALQELQVWMGGGTKAAAAAAHGHPAVPRHPAKTVSARGR